MRGGGGGDNELLSVLTSNLKLTVEGSPPQINR